MAKLNSTQRSFLEKTIVKARQLSEGSAVKALQNLAIDQSEPFTHMDTNQRNLRRRLCSKARLLGDEIVNGKQYIEHLSYELAYEYWHKMLFAKFLEANNLLIHPVHQVSVSFEDCEEFSREEGYHDKWTAAAHYASHMLPVIFRPEDPLMQVEFPTEDRLVLEQLLESIEEEIFIAGDSLGWVYQFWQSEEKDRINKSEEKIDGERLPAVTQLFTEPYMVHFLIDNTIGAWWVSRHPGEKPPVEFEYIRLLDDGTPAAGKFEGWPDNAKDINTLDPCMGSGHFIVELFNVLAPLRMHEEGLSKEEATNRVITDNLHGLEIDPRCTQIAAFNLAITAWRFNGKYIELPELNLACSGIAPKGKKEDWIKLVGDIQPQDVKARMENGIGELYDIFQKAPELGSLIEPISLKSDLHTASFNELIPLLRNAIDRENIIDNNDKIERGVIAFGVSKAIQIMLNSYYLLTTNFPFLGAKRMDEYLFNYSKNEYYQSRHDLAYILFERAHKLMKIGANLAVVMPNNWLKATRIKVFRVSRIENEQFRFIIDLGSGAFSQISGEVVKVILFISENQPNTFENNFSAIDCSRQDDTIKKHTILYGKITEQNQNKQLDNPNSKIILGEFNTDLPSLSKYADSFQGLMFKDRIRLLRYFWEKNRIDSNWCYLQSSIRNTSYFVGKNLICNWTDFINYYKTLGGNYKWNSSWGKKGICISQMSELPRSLFLGDKFDGNADVIIPKNENDLSILWSFIKSVDYIVELRKIDPKLDVNTASLVQVPFDYLKWKNIANENYPNGLPKPFSDDPTQWLFHGHPKPGENSLQATLCRLLWYQWPAEKDEEMELADEARQYIKEIQAFNHLSDEDGIVCIPSVNWEQPAAERLRDYIKEVWQVDWDNNTISNLLRQADSKKSNLEQWLREEFFEQHTKLFHNRPFIWNIWDGRKDGFSALVNYHKLDKAHLQRLIYTYLGDWIRQCELKVRDNEIGAEVLLIAAKKLKEKLELILEGEPPYDIFIRWKPLEKQPIGWEPDINDGVRLNIYPFIQAGILRKKPNIKWGKDRGKNPLGSLWGPERYNRYEDLEDEYKLKDEQGNIIYELTNDIKRKARKSINII